MALVNPVPAAQVPAFYPVLQPPSSIDYTSKDWLGFVTSMLNYAKIVLPQWDTSSEGDFGVMLVETVAYALDILSFYGDRLTQEAYLPTATQRLSILNLARLLGYVPTNGSPATGTVTFQNSTGTPIVVPDDTQVASLFNTVADQPLIYETNTAITVPANGTATVAVTQGISYTQQIIGISNGTAAQSFQIPQAHVEDKTVTVFVAGINTTNLIQWNQVTFLANAGPNDLSYSLFVDENQITNIQFGDNINGAIPGIGLTIYASYTIGAGSAGNQPQGTVGSLVTAINGISVPLQSSTSTLFQSSAMTGGSDPETNDQIRANAPLSYTTQQRAVSLTDFTNLALQVPGVLEASAVANHSTSVSLYILGPNYQPATTVLQTAVLNYFNGPPPKMLAGVTLSIGVPALILVDAGSASNNIQLQVLPNFNQGVVVQNVTTALQAVLSPPNTSFGELLQVSSLYSAVMAVPGVAWVVIPVMTREDVTQTNVNSIQFRQSEIPTAGSVFITATGGILT
jgi:uncharacterized phage protein gp47/JayE